MKPDEIRIAAEKRAEALQERSARPQLEQRAQRGTQPVDGLMERHASFSTEIRADVIERDGKQFQRVDGHATVFDAPYQMWDVFGPYEEVVTRGAADATLAAKPDVVFLINHRGLPLARTGGGWNDGNSTLDLSVDSRGLRSVAYLNPKRDEVRNLILAMDDKQVTEMSFGFMIDEGEWSEDFARYEISEFNLSRGDVSAVTYGANPHTDIASRQQDILRDLREAGPVMARAAMSALLQRRDLDIDELARRYDEQHRVLRDDVEERAAKGRSVLLIEALLEDALN